MLYSWLLLTGINIDYKILPLHNFLTQYLLVSIDMRFPLNYNQPKHY